MEEGIKVLMFVLRRADGNFRVGSSGKLGSEEEEEVLLKETVGPGFYLSFASQTKGKQFCSVTDSK